MNLPTATQPSHLVRQAHPHQVQRKPSHKGRPKVNKRCATPPPLEPSAAPSALHAPQTNAWAQEQPKPQAVPYAAYGPSQVPAQAHYPQHGGHVFGQPQPIPSWQQVPDLNYGAQPVPPAPHLATPPAAHFIHSLPTFMQPNTCTAMYSTPNGLLHYYAFATESGRTKVAMVGAAPSMQALYHELGVTLPLYRQPQDTGGQQAPNAPQPGDTPHPTEN